MSHTSFLNGLLIAAFLTTAAAGQANPVDAGSQPAAGKAAAGDNPFRAWRLAVEQQSLKPQAGMGYGGDPGMEMGGDYGGAAMGIPGGGSYGAGGFGEMGGYSGADAYGGEMGGYPGGGGYAGAYGGEHPDELFQKAVRDSVQRLAQAKTDAEKQQLLEAVRTAFHERYQQAIAQRQRELNRIEKQLQQLREDLERRRAAEQKVVEVQLRTIELAGEGLVQLRGE